MIYDMMYDVCCCAVLFPIVASIRHAENDIMYNV